MFLSPLNMSQSAQTIKFNQQKTATVYHKNKNKRKANYVSKLPF